LKVAYFSPLNPIKSGISDYSEELLEYLEGYGKIDLFINDYEPSTAWLYEHFDIYYYRKIYENNGFNDYDINIYHMGNSDTHSYIYNVLLDYPGIVVLHEPILHHFVFSHTVGCNRVREYLRELDYCYKAERPAIVKTTLEDRDESSWYEYPMLDRLVDSSLGVIVHSEFAKRQVMGVNSRANVRKIPLHYAPPPQNHFRPPQAVREILGFSDDDFLVGCHGFMTQSKRLDLLIEVLADMKEAGHKVKLLLVGKMLPGCQVLRWIEDHGMDGDVMVTGYVDTRTFNEYLGVPDLFAALRYPSAGETSASVIKMMGSGKPVLLSDYYAFSEFPDDCCMKVKPGDGEREEMKRRLTWAMRNRDEMKRMGENAREYVLSCHDIRNSAREYVDFATELLKGYHP
jgi:glycosyltransferase involved in cell wall biosynthesis